MHTYQFLSKNIVLLAAFMLANLALSTPALGQSEASAQTTPDISYDEKHPYPPYHEEYRLGFLYGPSGYPLYAHSRSKWSASYIDTAYKYAVSALQNNNPRAAAVLLRRVLRANRNHSAANYLMGLAQIDQGKKKAAQKYLEKAIKYDPDFAYSRIELAYLYAEAGKTVDAQEQIAWLEHEIYVCSNTCEEAADLIKGRTAIVAAMSDKKS